MYMRLSAFGREPCFRKGFLNKLSVAKRKYVIIAISTMDEGENSMQEERRIALCKWIDKHFDLMDAVEKEIWAHPETGYKEWRTHAYVKQQMEA